jgi:hypothetical protein
MFALSRLFGSIFKADPVVEERPIPLNAVDAPTADSDTDNIVSGKISLPPVVSIASNYTSKEARPQTPPLYYEQSNTTFETHTFSPVFIDDFDSEADDSNVDIQNSRTIPPPNPRYKSGCLKSWRSEQQAFDALQDFAKEHGFAIKKAQFKINRQGQQTRWVNCTRGGPRHNTRVATPNRQRRSASLITDEPCRFRAALRHDITSNRWTWDITQQRHSHAAVADISSLAIHRRNTRRATPGVTQLINATWDAAHGGPKDALELVRTMFPNALITPQDVRNQWSRHSSILDGGLPAIQALFQELDVQFVYNSVIDEDDALVHLVLFHHKAIDALRRWPYTLCIDTTYKTNQHGLYLCQIVGTSALNTSFIVGQAFLSSESTEAYEFVVDWLRQIYRANGLDDPTSITTDKSDALISALKRFFPTVPRLLCLWHVNKNVEAKAKIFFKAKLREDPHLSATQVYDNVGRQWSAFQTDWSTLLYSNNINDYHINYAKLYEKWGSSEPEMLTYLEKEWLSQKEHVIVAWTSKYLHFGNATTSRVEGVHRHVKSQLPEGGKLHIKEVVRRLTKYI